MFYRIKYYLSWWAYSFPIAAATIASLLMYHRTEIPFFKGLSYLMLVLLCMIIAVLIIKTIHAIMRKEICIEDI